MIPYLGCERARELLEPFADGELPVADQVAVESHLRWCRTCCARVEDLRLIAASLRLGAPAVREEDDQALASMQASALMRIRAEHDQSYGVMFREMFADMRFLWPALGATAAVLIFASLMAVIMHSSVDERRAALNALRSRPAPAMLAPEAYGVIVIQTSADPGSDLNPIRLDDAVSLPRMEDWLRLESLPEDDAIFTLATVVSRNGRIENYELLRSDRGLGEHQRSPEHAGHVNAVLDAVRNSRFAPAQAYGGRAVAVNMVWLIAKTTVVRESPRQREHVGARVVEEPRETPPPAVDVQDEPTLMPIEQRSVRARDSTTA